MKDFEALEALRKGSTLISSVSLDGEGNSTFTMTPYGVIYEHWKVGRKHFEKSFSMRRFISDAKAKNVEFSIKY